MDSVNVMNVWIKEFDGLNRENEHGERYLKQDNVEMLWNRILIWLTDNNHLELVGLPQVVVRQHQPENGPVFTYDSMIVYYHQVPRKKAEE